MAEPDLFLVIMAGGSGTRFWPKSTSRRPKQLLSFGREERGGDSPTLLERTLERFDGLVPRARRLIVTTRALEGVVAAQAASARVLAEPQGRNTAPCVYWAAREVAERDPRGVMLVMPADHHIARPAEFLETVAAAARWAATRDDLVTLGVRPDRPETGYGYLRMGPRVTEGSPCQRVEAFVEKPGLDAARRFLEAGNYLWNGGMFLWRAEVILREFDEHMPEMKAAWETAGGKVDEAYPRMTATSIDFGIMEKAKRVVGFPLNCGWDDLGSWTSLEAMADSLRARHPAGVVLGGEVVAIDATGNIVDAPGRLTALLGVRDLIIVEHGGALLVADKSRAQDIRLIVERLRMSGSELV